MDVTTVAVGMVSVGLTDACAEALLRSDATIPRE